VGQCERHEEKTPMLSSVGEAAQRAPSKGGTIRVLCSLVASSANMSSIDTRAEGSMRSPFTASRSTSLILVGSSSWSMALQDGQCAAWTAFCDKSFDQADRKEGIDMVGATSRRIPPWRPRAVTPRAAPWVIYSGAEGPRRTLCSPSAVPSTLCLNGR
jgi:hypothetical protein